MGRLGLDGAERPAAARHQPEHAVRRLVRQAYECLAVGSASGVNTGGIPNILVERWS
jgi:hypothetical protein